MGGYMAAHLVNAGHSLVIYDRRKEATKDLEMLGAVVADSPASLAKICRLVLLSLPGPSEIHEVVFGENGLISESQPSDIYVDFSSNSVNMAREINTHSSRYDVQYLDCPVTGGVPGAKNGTLTFLGSGDQTAFETVRPVLECMGSEIAYLGSSGNGCIAKLVNNVIVLCSGQLVQESLVLAAKAGIDPQVLDEVLRASTARPFVGLLPYLVGRRFDNPSFTLELAEKDIRLALDLAEDLTVPMPLTEAAHSTYGKALSEGLGNKSFLATLEILEKAAEVVVPTRDLGRGEERL